MLKFSVPEVDFISDLYGNPCMSDLSIFFNGNQWMILNDLFKSFQKTFPDIEHIFYETLPPGVLAKQIRDGVLNIGTLQINVLPDIYTSGKEEMQSLKEDGFISNYKQYASNTLAMLIPKNNPANIKSLNDLGKKGVRVVMPNPEYEGVGRLIVKALFKAGGDELVKQVMQIKVASGDTYLTKIHHRETINILLKNEFDVGPVWFTEALHQKKLGTLDYVSIDKKDNMLGYYYIAHIEKLSKNIPASKKFIDFITSNTAKKILNNYGFIA